MFNLKINTKFRLRFSRGKTSCCLIGDKVWKEPNLYPEDGGSNSPLNVNLHDPKCRHNIDNQNRPIHSLKTPYLLYKRQWPIGINC